MPCSVTTCSPRPATWETSLALCTSPGSRQTSGLRSPTLRFTKAGAARPLALPPSIPGIVVAAASDHAAGPLAVGTSLCAASVLHVPADARGLRPARPPALKPSAPPACTPLPAVGASNLGHIILYSILNQQEGLLCDRAYYPGDDMQVGGLVGGARQRSTCALLIGGGLAALCCCWPGSGSASCAASPYWSCTSCPRLRHHRGSPAQALLARYGRRLFGVESRRPLDEFDVLGFSLSYELGGTNILEMLRQSGVPVTWQVGPPPGPPPGSA